jgi:hypothetical protein
VMPLVGRVGSIESAQSVERRDGFPFARSPK